MKIPLLHKIKQRPLPSLKTLIIAFLLTGVFTEVTKFGAQHLSYRCTEVGSNITENIIVSHLQTIDLKFVQGQVDANSDKIEELQSSSNKDQAEDLIRRTRMLSAEIDKGLEELRNQQVVELPKQKKLHEEICSDASLLSGAVSFMSGLYNIILAVLLTLLGLLLSLNAPQRSKENEA